MTLRELKQMVDAIYEMHEKRADKITVGIPNNKGGMGAISTTGVIGVSKGIDWDSFQLFIWPENKMVEQLNKESND